MRIDIRDVLVNHARRYPRWGIEDLYKLLHQGALGSEHAIQDETGVRAWLERELANLGPGPAEPLIDPISPAGAIVRVHLRPYMRASLDPEALLEAFVSTANEVRGSFETLAAHAAEAVKLARGGSLPLPEANIIEFVEQMRLVGFPAVHHSPVYEAEYRPAYRVVARAFLPPEVIVAAR